MTKQDYGIKPGPREPDFWRGPKLDYTIPISDSAFAVQAGAPGSTDAERAAWLADKIGALGDYAKEAAAMLRRWPADELAKSRDVADTIAAIFAAVGYTEEYARQWPKEKASVTFKRWFDERVEERKAR